MSVHYSYWVTCDGCGTDVGEDADSERDALDAAKDEGWVTTISHGDLCPDCWMETPDFKAANQ